MTISSIPHFQEVPPSSESRTIHGVGINNATYPVHGSKNGSRVYCPFYTTWTRMIQRCYSEVYILKYPTYINCIICDEWLIFSKFKKWMEGQDWEGKQLDKDLLVENNRIYSPKTCIFVEEDINLLFTDSKTRRGKYPIGVSYVKRLKKYKAQCSVNKSVGYLGLFETAGEAHAVYKKAKAKEIIKRADLQKDPKIKMLLYKKAGGYL